MAQRKPDPLAAFRRPSPIQQFVRFKREDDFNERTARLIERLEGGAFAYQSFDRACQSLIAHLRTVELASTDIKVGLQ